MNDDKYNDNGIKPMITITIITYKSKTADMLLMPVVVTPICFIGENNDHKMIK